MNLILFIICCTLLFGADVTKKGLGCLVKVILLGLALMFLILASIGMNGGGMA